MAGTGLESPGRGDPRGQEVAGGGKAPPRTPLRALPAVKRRRKNKFPPDAAGKRGRYTQRHTQPLESRGGAACAALRARGVRREVRGTFGPGAARKPAPPNPPPPLALLLRCPGENTIE